MLLIVNKKRNHGSTWIIIGTCSLIISTLALALSQVYIEPILQEYQQEVILQQNQALDLALLTLSFQNDASDALFAQTFGLKPTGSPMLKRSNYVISVNETDGSETMNISQRYTYYQSKRAKYENAYTDKVDQLNEKIRQEPKCGMAPCSELRTPLIIFYMICFDIGISGTTYGQIKMNQKK